LAFRTYVERWALNIPHQMISEHGECCRWRFKLVLRGWFQYNWRFDQGLMQLNT
jgi:hypothetical protein